MIMTAEQFQSLCRFVRSYLEESAAKNHPDWVKEFPRLAEQRWQHTLNVLRNAEKILTGERASEEQAEIVRAAVILHDVSMFVSEHEVHGEASAQIAESYLLESGFPAPFVGRVRRAVAEHGIDLGPLPPEEQGALLSWEGKVVLEADILDKLGVSAVTNGLLYLVKRGRLPHEFRSGLVQGSAMERARIFKDYIWTETGRRLAESRFSFFMAYLDQLEEEVDERAWPFEQ